MKLLMGFIILLVALVAVTGCTQTTTSEQTNATTTATPAATTEATTVVTTIETTVPATTETIVANVTEPVTTVTETANVTTEATTAAIANVTATPTYASQVTTIHITSTGFDPQYDVLLPGTGVSFINDDNVTHSVKTIGDNAGMFNSGDLIPKTAFTFSFSEKTGTYVYALDGNTSVTGTIIVKTGRTLSG